MQQAQPAARGTRTRESRRVRLGLFAAGLATFALLYTPQPLLPLLSGAFHTSPAGASLAMSAGTAALALAIIPVSSLSEVVGRRAVMITSVLAAAVLGLLRAARPIAARARRAVRVLEGFAASAGVPAVRDGLPRRKRSRAATSAAPWACTSRAMPSAGSAGG